MNPTNQHQDPFEWGGYKVTPHESNESSHALAFGANPAPASTYYAAPSHQGGGANAMMHYGGSALYPHPTQQTPHQYYPPHVAASSTLHTETTGTQLYGQGNAHIEKGRYGSASNPSTVNQPQVPTLATAHQGQQQRSWQSTPSTSAPTSSSQAAANPTAPGIIRRVNPMPKHGKNVHYDHLAHVQGILYIPYDAQGAEKGAVGAETANNAGTTNEESVLENIRALEVPSSIATAANVVSGSSNLAGSNKRLKLNESSSQTSPTQRAPTSDEDSSQNYHATLRVSNLAFERTSDLTTLKTDMQRLITAVVDLAQSRINTNIMNGLLSKTPSHASLNAPQSSMGGGRGSGAQFGRGNNNNNSGFHYDDKTGMLNISSKMGISNTTVNNNTSATNPNAMSTMSVETDGGLISSVAGHQGNFLPTWEVIVEEAVAPEAYPKCREFPLLLRLKKESKKASPIDVMSATEEGMESTDGEREREDAASLTRDEEDESGTQIATAVPLPLNTNTNTKSAQHSTIPSAATSTTVPAVSPITTAPPTFTFHSVIQALQIHSNCLADRKGFLVATTPAAIAAMKQYCLELKEKPQAERHWRTDGLPCNPLSFRMLTQGDMENNRSSEYLNTSSSLGGSFISNNTNSIRVGHLHNQQQRMAAAAAKQQQERQQEMLLQQQAQQAAFMAISHGPDPSGAALNTSYSHLQPQPRAPHHSGQYYQAPTHTNPAATTPYHHPQAQPYAQYPPYPSASNEHPSAIGDPQGYPKPNNLNSSAGNGWGIGHPQYPSANNPPRGPYYMGEHAPQPHSHPPRPMESSAFPPYNNQQHYTTTERIKENDHSTRATRHEGGTYGGYRGGQPDYFAYPYASQTAATAPSGYYQGTADPFGHQPKMPPVGSHLPSASAVGPQHQHGGGRMGSVSSASGQQPAYHFPPESRNAFQSGQNESYGKYGDLSSINTNTDPIYADGAGSAGTNGPQQTSFGEGNPKNYNQFQSHPQQQQQSYHQQRPPAIGELYQQHSSDQSNLGGSTNVNQQGVVVVPKFRK